MVLELVPAVGARQQRLVQEVHARLVDVLREHALEQLLEPRVFGSLEPQDPRRADQHAHRGRLVEPLGLVGEPLDFVGPELGIVVDRGERVLDPDRVRGDLERALEDRQRLVLLTAVEQCFADDAREVARGRRAAKLHLAELRDHLEAPDLAVHLARARQRLEVIRMKLPGSLIQPERAFTLGNHVLDERGQLEQPLGLLGLRARSFQFFLELIDCNRPISRPAKAFPKQCTRIHLRSILPQTQKKPRPTP